MRVAISSCLSLIEHIARGFALSTQLTYTDRYALGLRARKQLSRSAHADFSLTACKSNVLDVLQQSERGRVVSLLKIKHERMAASAFGFFRGAVPVMAADLACHPNTGIETQLCGDAHVSNLGAFCGMDGNLVFDINDFDETLRGPFEFDVKRLATSLLLAGREAGIKRTARRDAVQHFLERYRESMQRFSSMPVLELARYQIHRLGEIEPMPAIFAQAERSTPQRALKSLTEFVEKKHNVSERHRRFQNHPPRLTPLPPKEKEAVLASLLPYARTLQPERRHFLAQYKPVDVAFKVVGTGSVGLRDYCIYFESPSRPEDEDPLFLQIKEETQSSWAPYLPENDHHTHQGHRAMDGQRAMQLSSDPFLGYTTIDGRDYLVRQLNDHKAALDLDKLTAAGLLGYADLCGELFARGHARAGDAIEIAAYIGSGKRFDNAILSFARAYADKTEQDWNHFKKSLPAVQQKQAKKIAKAS